ncbi:MAG TPA: hypothetical protein VFQ59_03375 [Candidatus Paceibacterota bacterium]|nr:hypothetical protein [Candidatus Paceibacterota bacterium]
MIKKFKEKEKAITLRKKGKTYSEILSAVPVAKSTLSLWLKEAGIAKAENQKYTEARRLAGKRGGEAKRRQRIEKQSRIISESKSQIGPLTHNERFLIGVALYWAEGSKEKQYHPGSQIGFANSDPNMIKLFLKWLEEIGIQKSDICLDVFLHENNEYRKDEVLTYWIKITDFPSQVFRIYYKKNILSTKRKNVYPEKYFGLLKIRVMSSSSLVRKITGWVEGIIENFN